MTRSVRQFEIKSLLILMSLACCGLRFCTLEGSIPFRILVTMTLATFVTAVVALIWFVALPMLQKD